MKHLFLESKTTRRDSRGSGGGFAAGKFASKTIDKSIPMPDSKNVAAKAAIDKTKTEVKEAVDSHEGDD